MILLRVGNRNFCFANNRGTFLKTMKGHQTRATACHCQLKNATKNMIKFHSFHLLFFISLTLCYFYFLVNPWNTRTLKNDLVFHFTLLRPGFVLLPVTGTPSKDPLYNFRTAYPSATKITHNNELIDFKFWA